jgi:Zn finger protein HypA/HybF involved in hydrogenase expression
MHDFHAAESLVDRLRSERADRELELVSEVRIRASLVFSPEALAQGYEMLTRGTPLEGSQLVIEELPREHRCPECGGSWRICRDDVAGHMLVCPACGAPSAIEASAAIELLSLRTRDDMTARPTKQEELA